MWHPFKCRPFRPRYVSSWHFKLDNVSAGVFRPGPRQGPGWYVYISQGDVPLIEDVEGLRFRTLRAAREYVETRAKSVLKAQSRA